MELFERATVIHMLEVDMNEDCRELVCGLSRKVLDISKCLLQRS